MSQSKQSGFSKFLKRTFFVSIVSWLLFLTSVNYFQNRAIVTLIDISIGQQHDLQILQMQRGYATPRSGITPGAIREQ